MSNVVSIESLLNTSFKEKLEAIYDTIEKEIDKAFESDENMVISQLIGFIHSIHIQMVIYMAEVAEKEKDIEGPITQKGYNLFDYFSKVEKLYKEMVDNIPDEEVKQS